MAIDPKYHRGAEASSLSRVEVHSLDIAALEGIVFRQALQALQEASRPLSMPYPSRLTNEQ
ncbi:MAG: hypothetical protein KC548_06780, partial [Nanoarchaeota archaeon]|nr:hypothetical protein [Nanoarchaeota archaeon]